ncbi:MAG: SDR family oxidoreductase [Clostridiales bacterium]|nr:SDR family oxidoreductase [Clostridiales bacterium]
MSHAFVTGGSRGIGRAICMKFASNGFKVSYVYKNNPGPKGLNILPIHCDVSSSDQVIEAVKKASDEFGDIDILISNSGISRTGLATDLDFSDYRNVMDTNFGGLFNTANAIIPTMIHNKSGAIIAISSMWGQTGASCEALYSASKGAVDAYIKSLAKELAPSGIRVNAVSPGCIDTDMMASFTEEEKKMLENETPLGRLGSPEDVAETVFYLTSESASFITGQIIGVNGGFLI